MVSFRVKKMLDVDSQLYPFHISSTAAQLPFELLCPLLEKREINFKKNKEAAETRNFTSKKTAEKLSPIQT